MNRLENISYGVTRSKRAKRMRISVRPDGSVTLIIPHRASEAIGQQFVQEKSAWIIATIARLQQSAKAPHIKRTNKDFLQHKYRALRLARRKVELFSKQLGVQHGIVNVKNQKTRWGSCSKTGNLSFNFRILFLHEDLQNYLVIHELCHLKEFNHSPRFWKAVESIFPEYRNARRELKQSPILSY